MNHSAVLQRDDVVDDEDQDVLGKIADKIFIFSSFLFFDVSISPLRSAVYPEIERRCDFVFRKYSYHFFVGNCLVASIDLNL